MSRPRKTGVGRHGWSAVDGLGLSAELDDGLPSIRWGGSVGPSVVGGSTNDGGGDSLAPVAGSPDPFETATNTKATSTPTATSSHTRAFTRRVYGSRKRGGLHRHHVWEVAG